MKTEKIKICVIRFGIGYVMNTDEDDERYDYDKKSYDSISINIQFLSFVDLHQWYNP